ncbi:hypothetical protein TWF694_009093 [Orbilia ellipsospora]|uniref:Uncharacterized protein n=1 Tax=Orbilia ellipsospora TaxID=2528407 RepID=A0AAV9XEU4_9PEZI
MSSNPFRRKQNDGTPSASGRTSFDIDQERLQQVAQQAFADGDDAFGAAGSSGPKPAPDVQPSLPTTDPVKQEIDPISQNGDARSRDGSRRPSTEVADPEKRPEIQVEVQPESPVDTISSISSAVPVRTPTKAPSAGPTPPHLGRPLAPPAPPRPRRSVKRRPSEPKERKSSLEEPPVVVEPIPVAPSNDDPFTESKKEVEEAADEEETRTDESSIIEIKKEEAEIGSVKSIESEYEEDSPSEISEIPTISAGSVSAKTIASDPEYAEASAAILGQAPNPFRKRDDSDSPTRRHSSDDDRFEMVSPRDATPPSIKFGAPNNIPKAVKNSRQSMDVDAFKHLMLTGQATHTPDSVTTTETSNVSKQSLLESAEHYITPRSSQDTGRSGEELEQLSKVAPATTPPKAKPPPPKPRGQRHSMMAMPPPPRSDPHPTPSKETTEAPISQEAPSTPPKTPKPPVPLSRRMSAQIVPSADNTLSLQFPGHPTPPPPPPPPSRRLASSPNAQSTTPTNQTQEPPPPLSLSISPLPNKKPTPPPTRRGSKRMSAPPGRLQSLSSLSKSSAPAPAPPPPPRKKSQLSQSTTEGAADSIPEPAPRVSASFDILEDLTKLQKEVDELLGRV